jgi:hypothetical protein
VEALNCEGYWGCFFSKKGPVRKELSVRKVQSGTLHHKASQKRPFIGEFSVRNIQSVEKSQSEKPSKYEIVQSEKPVREKNQAENVSQKPVGNCL